MTPAQLRSPTFSFHLNLVSDVSILFTFPHLIVWKTFCGRCLQRSLDHRSHCPICRTDLPDFSYLQDTPQNKVVLSIGTISFLIPPLSFRPSCVWHQSWQFSLSCMLNVGSLSKMKNGTRGWIPHCSSANSLSLASRQICTSLNQGKACPLIDLTGTLT